MEISKIGRTDGKKKGREGVGEKEKSKQQPWRNLRRDI